MIKQRRYLPGIAHRPIPTYYRLQAGLYLTGALVTLFFAALAQPAVQSSLFATIIFKLSVFFLTISCFTVLAVAPIVWLNMIEVAPKAMFQFRRARLFVVFFLRFVGWFRRVKIRPYARLQRQRPFQSGYYSLANLFAVTAVPYRLYPLSCTLLE